MAKINNFTLTRDKGGNLGEVRNPDMMRLLYSQSAGVSTATASAAVAAVTMPASSGDRYVVDSAQLCIASIAANTMVLATVFDGSTAVLAKAFSANGQYDLLKGADVDETLRLIGTNNSTLSVLASSAGTGSTTTLQLFAHKVKAADL